jgi:hypothetical protein
MQRHLFDFTLKMVSLGGGCMAMAFVPTFDSQPELTICIDPSLKLKT